MLVCNLCLSGVMVPLTLCRIFALPRPSSSMVGFPCLSPWKSSAEFDGTQLAKPSSVRTLRGLVLPSHGILHDPYLSDPWMNIWPRTLTEFYCFRLLSITATSYHSLRYLPSHGCPCLVAIHICRIPKRLGNVSHDM